MYIPEAHMHERQSVHDQIDHKLRLEWEARATLEINRRVELAEAKLHSVFDQRVLEEVEKKLAEVLAAQNQAVPAPEPYQRSSTPTASLEESTQATSLGTVNETDEEFPSGTDLTSLSLEDSPLVKKKPLNTTSEGLFCTRSRGPNEA